MFVVYKHIRIDNNTTFYIGMGNIKRPYRKSDRNKYWHHIVNKVGYKVEIIYDNLTWEEARILEIELIAKYGRHDLGKGLLVNVTNGGEGCHGYKQTKEHIASRVAKQIGKKRTEEVKKIMSEKALLRGVSQHVIDNLKIASIGRPSATRRKISQFDKQNNLIKNYDYIMEAARECSINMQAIHNNLTNKTKSSGGFIWKYRN